MTGRENQSGRATRIAIVVSRYNRSVTDRLLAGAIEEFERRGGRRADLEIIDAPGAFELPALAGLAAAQGKFDGILALGCIIRGETEHDRYIAEAVAAGLTQVALANGVPVGFGVLTVNNADQAMARTGGDHGNKGTESMGAVMDAIRSARTLTGEATPPIADPAPPRPDKASDQPRRVSRDARRLAFQALYQLDVSPDSALAELSIASAPDATDRDKAVGLALAIEAFQHRANADADMAALAPDWPPHRQPAVDRAILRLAHYEMTSGRTPAEIAINEAVELAKQFSTERSPAFVNALLDRAAHDRGLIETPSTATIPDPVGG